MTVLRARVLTPEGPGAVQWFEDAIVVIEGGRITHVGPFDGRSVDEDLRPGVLTPGFVDAHVHFPQTRIVGAASGPLLEWLAKSTFPEEARFADPTHAKVVAKVFAAKLAASGTTLAFAYGPVFTAASDALLTEFARTGQRAIVGPVLMDANCPSELMVPREPAIEALDALADKWHGHEDRLFVAAIPRFALSCSAEIMRAGAELAQRRDLWVSTHLSENREECRVACEMFRTDDYLRVYEDAGILRSKSLFAHCIHLSDSEWERFANAGAVVAHCPDSNAFLGSGNMPLASVLERGIPLTVGTDVAAGRSFRIARTLSHAYDNALATGRPTLASELLWWGTRGGAEALGFANIGLLAPGYEADLVLWEVPPWAETAEAVLGALLFDGDLPAPRATWVGGRRVYWRAGEASS